MRSDLGDNPFADVPVGTEFQLEIERTHIQKGATFSESALRNLLDTMNLFVATQISKSWDTTGKAPTKMTISIRCDIEGTD